MSCKNVLAVAAALVLFAVPAFAGEWVYYGQEGEYTPDAWSHIHGYEACAGYSQSPIDIVTTDAIAGNVGLDYTYRGDVAEYLNNGHAVKVTPLGRSITVTDAQGVETQYDLLQFHFHTLSEHTVDGEHRAMEMHLVHQSADGMLAVLGVFIEEGEANKVLGDIFDHLPHAAGHGEEAPALMAEIADNYEKLLPAERAFWSYSGSLTTPPCSEIVTWLVFKEPVTLSAEQIEAYRELYEEEGNLYDTNRPVQALNARPVTSND